MRFQAANRCLMASVWWGSDFRLSTLGLILVEESRPSIRGMALAAPLTELTATREREGLVGAAGRYCRANSIPV